MNSSMRCLRLSYAVKTYKALDLAASQVQTKIWCTNFALIDKVVYSDEALVVDVPLLSLYLGCHIAFYVDNAEAFLNCVPVTVSFEFRPALFVSTSCWFVHCSNTSRVHR